MVTESNKMNEPINDLNSMLNYIRTSLKKPIEAPVSNPRVLPRNKIACATAVFQTRTLEGNLGADEAHIQELMDVIGNPKKPKLLDPVTVWWGGDRFYLIDGHHRLIAYGRKKVAKSIPVDVFKGTLDEAMAKAGALNSKNKMPMTNTDRCNYAWRMVCVSKLSKASIAEACGVGTATIGNMRRTKIDLTERLKEPLEEISEMSWNEARMTSTGLNDCLDFDPDAATRDRAIRFSKVISKSLGDRPAKDPEAFAMALCFVDKRLPEWLMQSQSWSGSLKAVMEEREAVWDTDGDY